MPIAYVLARLQVTGSMMDNISNVNPLVPQGQNASASTGPTASGTTDAGGQFGLLLTQQLQQILTQGAVPEMAPGLEGEAALDVALNNAAQLPEPVTDLKGAGVEEVLRDALLTQAGPSGINVSKPARGIGKSDELAEKVGKKLPLDLPLQSKPDPKTLVDDATLASMVAAQVLPQVQQSVPQTGTAKADTSLLENITSKGVSSGGHEISALISSEVPATPQATPQSFSALMTERAVANVSTNTLPTLEIPQRVDSNQWGNGLGDKVVWMVGSHTQGAELRLNPPALGPLEIRVSMSDGQATLSFMTQHAPVREAIEAATPRLRELLADSGINLGSVSVNVGTFAQQQSGSQEQSQQKSSAGHWSAAFGADDEGAGFAAPVATSVRYLRDGGMVDLFA